MRLRRTGHCRIAVENAVACPVTAQMAAQTSNLDAVLSGQHHHASSDGSSSRSAAGPSSASDEHVANLVHIVGLTGRACWVAVSEQDKLRPAQCQALLSTFFAACLFLADSPSSLRQVCAWASASVKTRCHCQQQWIKCSECQRLLAVARCRLAYSGA